ncbi:hypothetical protein BHYA_0338g00020 [Botrytis hyacinthi]|uniref:Uncharacterized protein n=1 Tax=Botrytis hyacinthi TaxID=278943 RepID=A0A4Z1G9U2_9HELO|nr:hypothetical protein BHYA_0338g00020 [Botrytis hyacinthi]
MDSDPEVFVGLDIGTYLAKASYRLRRNGTTHDIFIGSTASPYECSTASSTIPSGLYYLQDSDVPLWGGDVAGARYLNDDDSDRLIQYWKNGLQPGSPFHMDMIAKSQLLKLKIDHFPFQMVVHLLNRLFFDDSALLRSTIRKASCNLGDVCLIFGKPSGWQMSTYKVFQDAAESLGFTRRQIKFVSETEAFLREYLKGGEDFEKDDTIVIAGCGGYTVDIDAYQIVGLDEDVKSITQVSPAGILPLSLPYGSESVWPIAKQHFRSLLTEKGDYIEDDIKLILDDLLPRWIWEVQKAKNIPHLLASNGCHIFFQGLIRADETRTPPWSAGKLRISWKTIVGLFQEASIDPIVNELRIFIKRLPTKPTRVILGGGYSTMSIVKDALFELGKELDIKFYQHPDSKPVAAGAVDMAANPDIVESRLLKSSYSILTKFPWSEKEGPHEIYQPSRNQYDHSWEFKAHDWMGKVGDKISSKQIFTSDSNEYLWRERFVREHDDLSWQEIINYWDVHPGPGRFTVPRKLQGAQCETITLNVDFRKNISDFSVLRKKKGYFYIQYSLELHLDGDSLTFIVKTKDKNGNHYIVEIDDLGTTISSVILTGDCAQTREERSSNISNSTTADKTSSASTCGSHVKTSSHNIGINTSPDGASSQACNSVNPLTPTPSLVDPFEKIEYDSVNINLLLDQHHISSKELEDPFSSSCPRPKSDLYKPARRPRKGMKSKKVPTLETPQVPRPTTLDDIGLPINNGSQSIDELSSSVLPLPSPVLPEDTIVVRRRKISFTTPARFE